MSKSENLIKQNKELLDKINTKSLVSTSLKDKIQLLSKYKGKVLLCDVSGSMDAHCGEATAIDILRSTINNFPGATIYEFSNYCKEVKVLSNPNGSTMLDLAFKVLVSNGITEICLITDGRPNDEKAALAASAYLDKIDIIYIGPKPVPDFLVQLAKLRKGSFVDVDLIAKDAQKELETKIKGLLSVGS